MRSWSEGVFAAIAASACAMIAGGRAAASDSKGGTESLPDFSAMICRSDCQIVDARS